MVARTMRRHEPPQEGRNVTVPIADLRSLAVVGLWRSGRAAGLLARRMLPNAVVVAIDEKAEAELGPTPAELRAAGAALLLGDRADLPAGVELLVKSPGVPTSSRVVAAALERGVPFIWSEAPVRGALSHEPLDRDYRHQRQDHGYPAHRADPARRRASRRGGRQRRQSFPPRPARHDRPRCGRGGRFFPAFLQLEHIERFRPDVAVLLNLTEDHIDRHGSYAGYIDAKLRVFENQTPADLALVNLDDPDTAGIAASLPGRGRRGGFSLGAPVVPVGAAFAALAGVADGTLWLQAGEGASNCARSPRSP